MKEIVDRLDFFMDGWNQYLNKKTGDIVEIQMEYLSIAEESEDDDDLCIHAKGIQKTGLQ